MRLQGLMSPPIHKPSGSTWLGVGKLWLRHSGFNVVILSRLLFLSHASHSSYFKPQFLKWLSWQGWVQLPATLDRENNVHLHLFDKLIKVLFLTGQMAQPTEMGSIPGTFLRVKGKNWLHKVVHLNSIPSPTATATAIHVECFSYIHEYTHTNPL